MELLTAPKNLKEDIFAAIELEKEEKRRKKKRNTLLYTWEVRLVTAAAVLLVFLLPSFELHKSEEIPDRREPSVLRVVGEKSDELCGRIFRWSNTLVRMDGIKENIEILEQEEDIQ